jgi:hypothetical protein
MPIVFVENQYPVSKNNEVLAAWFRAVEKYPRPDGVLTTLVDTAVRGEKDGLRVLSAHLISPGKYEEAMSYLMKFITEFFNIEGYSYEIKTWSTIEEAMTAIGQQAPDR